MSLNQTILDVYGKLSGNKIPETSEEQISELSALTLKYYNAKQTETQAKKVATAHKGSLQTRS